MAFPFANDVDERGLGLRSRVIADVLCSSQEVERSKFG